LIIVTIAFLRFCLSELCGEEEYLGDSYQNAAAHSVFKKC